MTKETEKQLRLLKRNWYIFRLAFALAGPLGRNYIVICFDLLIDFVNHCTDF